MSRTYHDPITGARIHQMTDHPSINHATYFLQSSFTPDNHTLIFTSYRTGSAQLFEIDFPMASRANSRPERRSIRSRPPSIPRAGSSISCAAAKSGRSIARPWSSAKSWLIPRRQLGECSLAAGGDWLTAAIKQGKQCGLVAGRADGTGWHLIPFPRTVIHPQFHPLEPEWIEFSGDPAPRMHRVRRDGSGLECLYEHANDEFIVHETFLGSTGEWCSPSGRARLSAWTGLRVRCGRSPNTTRGTSPRIAPGRRSSAIPTIPTAGCSSSTPRPAPAGSICLTESSNQGSQWKTAAYALAEDFARAQAPPRPGALSWMEVATDSVYGPQWTHPHPSFSPNEKLVTFASDRTGHPQVYVVEIPGA